MRVTGKIILWLGILIIAGISVLALIAVTASYAAGEAEVMGWAMIYGMFFGVPLLILGGLLILIGAVLVTSAPKQTPAPATPTAPPPPNPYNKSRYVAQAAPRDPHTSRDDQLRAAFTKTDSKLHVVVMALRVAAIGVFFWFFIPKVQVAILMSGAMASMSFAQIALVFVMSLLGPMIIPLILWLVSNFIKMRANATDGLAA